MIMGGTRNRANQSRRFEDLADAQIVAPAISNEQEAAHTYRDFAEALKSDYRDSARLFLEMAEQETGHLARLTALFKRRFGQTIPVIVAN